MTRLIGARDAIRSADGLDEEIEQAYPRDRFRTPEQPDRDYSFQPADVLELERAMRRRLRV
jgi:hypothetical protein